MASVSQQILMSSAQIPVTAFFGSFAANSVAGISTTHSTTGLTAGNVDGSRYIFAVVYWVKATSIATIVSASIGGVPAKIHLQSNQLPSSVNYNVALISAFVPTGTTVNVDTTFSATIAAPGVYTFPTYNMISDTAYASTSNASPNPTLIGNTNVKTDGVVFIAAMRYPDGNVGSVSGASTSYASGAILAASFSVCGGFYLPTINESPRSISDTIGSATVGGNNHFSLVASFR